MKTADHARHAIRQVLFFLTLLAVLLIASGHVHAAADRVMYNDGSGLYLQKIRGEWHLRKPNGTPGVGLQYVSIDRTENLTSGYYVFNREGRLLNKTTILRFRQKKSHNVTFDGFYYVPSTGRIYKNARGLIYIDELKCDGYTFKGFYYVDTYGKLNSTIPRVHYISMMKLHGIAFHSGYYCFDKAGRLCIGAGLRRIEEQTEGKIKFKGYYYFDDNGRLYTKEGMIRIGNSFYYLTKEGKMLAGTWMKGRYYLSNGRMAASMMTPDGTWVDEYGRKIEVSEGRLLKLKTKLNSMIAGYGGIWSVYVKDLKTNNMLSINDRSMYAASTIKAFAMAETYNLIAAK